MKKLLLILALIFSPLAFAADGESSDDKASVVGSVPTECDDISGNTTVVKGEDKPADSQGEDSTKDK